MAEERQPQPDRKGRENWGYHVPRVLAFLVVGVALYGGVLNAFFLADDFVILNAIAVAGPFGFWTDASSNFFRPLVSLSFYVDHAIWGLNPLGFHLTNVLVHALNAYLLFLAARSLLIQARLDQGTFSAVPALAGIAFLILHNHTEAVSWISGRTDLLATLFGLASLCAFLRYRETGRAALLPASLLLFACGLLAKESVLLLPLVILILDAYLVWSRASGMQGWIRALRVPALYFLLLVAYFPARYLTIGKLVGGHGADVHLSSSLLSMAFNLAAYCYRLLFPPMPLNRPPGDFLPGVSADEVRRLLPLAALLLAAMSAAAGALVVARIRRLHGGDSARLGGLLATLGAAVLLALLPVVTLGVSLQDTQHERYLYLPTAFVSLLLPLFLCAVLRRPIAFAVFAVFALLSGVALIRSNQNWRIAGEVSRGVLDSLAGLERVGRLFIVNLPDHFNGAYVYRNRIALRDAVRLFGPHDRIGEMAIITYNSVRGTGDRAIATERGPRRYAVSLSDPHTYFRIDEHPRERTPITGNYAILGFHSRGYELVFEEWNEGDELMVYGGGKLMPVSPQPNQMAYPRTASPLKAPRRPQKMPATA